MRGSESPFDPAFSPNTAVHWVLGPWCGEIEIGITKTSTTTTRLAVKCIGPSLRSG